MKTYRLAKFAALVITALTAIVGTAHAQSTGSISGKVSDKNNPGFLEGVLVRVEGASLATATNRFGEYTLSNIPQGNQTVIFSYIGYAPETRSIQVQAGGRNSLDIEMGERIVDLETFVVTGRLVGTARALNQQKTADSYRSVIASDAIGQLPDENAAEALNRIAGISVERDQGEGRFVVIRGIDPELNNVQLSGVSLPAPEDSTRKVALDVIPSELISGLEVTKVATPDMDAAAIGGTVDIKMKSPFDAGGRIMSAKASLLHSDKRGGFGEKFSLTWGDLFMDDKLGFIVGVSYGEKKTASDNNEIDGPWVMTEDIDEDFESDFWVPEEIEYREYNVSRYRQGISTALEYKPDEDRYFYVKAAANYFADQEARYRVEIKAADAGSIGSASATGATFLEVEEADRDLKDRFEEQYIYSVVAGSEITLGNTFIDYSVSYSYAEENEPDRIDTDFRNKKEPFDIQLDWSDPYHVAIVEAGPSFWDPTAFKFNDFVIENNHADQEEVAAKFNFRRDFEMGDSYGSFKTGVKFAKRYKTTDLELQENDEEIDALSDLRSIADVNFGRNTFGQGTRASVSRTRSLIKANLPAYAMERNEEDSESGDYNSEESIIAAYGMGTFHIADLTIIAGVRAEKTEFETNGNNIVFDEEGDIVEIQSISADKSYTDLFPHLHLRYDINESIVARASINKTIARPKFSHSALRRSISREDEEIVTGNPDLNPYESWNFDASVEFYSPNLGLFSLAYFYKDISDYVFDLESSIEDPETGYDLISFFNGESAKIQGLEISFNRELTFLPAPFDGLGINATLTLSDSEANTDIRSGDNLRFLKQSDTIGTLALYYQNGGFNARIAGTYRSDYIDEFGEEYSADRWVDNHFQVDLTTSYQFNDSFSVFAEIINLNDEPFRAYFDVSNGLSQYEEYGWSGSFGFKFSL